MDRMDPVADLGDDTWNTVIDVNLTGPMRLFRAAIPEREKTGGGSLRHRRLRMDGLLIVVVSSRE